MTKWINLGISKVRYDDDGKMIGKAEIYKVCSGNLVTKRIWPRKNLVAATELGLSIVTIRIKADNSFEVLEPVERVQHGGGIYFSVRGVDEPRDYLGNLPRM